VLAFRTVTYCTENEETPQPVAMVNADVRALIAQLAHDAVNQGWLQSSEASLLRVAETAH
jgi:hypothetical protein